MSLLHEVRIALRTLTREPLFSLVAVLTLVLGIGATTAIFSVVKAVLLDSLPYRAPGELVVLRERSPQGSSELVSPPTFLDWRSKATMLEGLGAYRTVRYSFRSDADPIDLPSVRATPELFELLGVGAQLGRTFTPEEGKPGKDRVAILSHGFWTRQLGANPAIIGRSIALDTNLFTVVGVMSAEFSFPPGSEIHLWTPLSFDPNDAHGRSRRARSLNVVGRLRHGVTRERAQVEMETIASALASEYPDTNKGFSANVESIHEQLVAAARPALLLLLATVSFLLLIACANVASLMLARLETRRREMALRSALGASRATLGRQVFVESLLLSMCGAALGVLAAVFGVRMARHLPLSRVPRLDEVGIDGGVLAFTALVSILVAFAFGLLPALHALKRDLVSSLNEGGRSGSGGTRRVLGSIAGLEVALAVVLLTGAGLSLQSFFEMMRVDPGFRPDSLLAAQIYLPQAKYGDEESRLRFFTDALSRLRALPGVQSAGAASALPMHPVGIDFSLPFAIEGRNPPASGEEPRADIRAATEGYFETMKIPLLRGRLFDAGDKRDAPHRILINETLARRYFPGEEPMGRVIVNPHGSAEIVGVVADVHHYGLDSEPRPELYAPLQQGVFNGMTLVVRTTVAPERFAADLRRTIREIDSDQAIYDMSTMEEAMARWVFLPRLSMTLLASFAASALALAALGIYGVIAYSVSQRSLEMGLRMALGAAGADLMVLVLGGSLRFVLPGMVAGLALAAALARLLARQLFGVRPFDPTVYLTVGLLLLLTALAAGYLPARRATRVDPIEALRAE